MNNGVNWDYYDKFEAIEEKYLPARGEGETMATQIVTAVTKLVYKWYNDGDVYDNTHYLDGWCNDLSSYANWLARYTDKADCLYRISEARTDEDYELILKDLTDATHDADYLAEMDKREKVGSIYDCKGRFEFSESDDDEWY